MVRPADATIRERAWHSADVAAASPATCISGRVDETTVLARQA